MFFLRQSTNADIKLGPFVDKTDGVAYETGMAAAMDSATTGVRLSKNGAALADRSEATQPSYDAFGYYLVKLDTTDTSTVGNLKVIFGDAAVCLPCEAQFQVLEEAIFDSLFAASAAGFDANQRVNVGQWLSQAVTLSTGNKPDVNIDEISDDTTAPGNLELMYDGTGYAGGTAKLNVNVAAQDNIDFGALQKASITAAVPTAAVVADAVWDELVTGHDGAGKAGAQLWTDIDAIAVDVAGLDGAAMRGTDSAALASVCTEGRLSELDAGTGGKMANVVDIIAVDVAGLDGAAMRGTDSAALASVCTEGRLAELDAANLPTDVAARATPAQVNAEVLDVLNVDTFAEPGQEAPAATNTLAKKIGYLFKAWRNRNTQTASQYSLYGDDATTVDQKATYADDATTSDRGEIASGL